MVSPKLSLRDRRYLELGLVQNRRSSGDRTAGRRARNRMSSMNSTRMAVVGSFFEALRAISLGPEVDPDRDFFWDGPS